MAAASPAQAARTSIPVPMSCPDGSATNALDYTGVTNTVTFLSGVTLLCLSYLEPGQVLDAPIRHAAAETLPAHEPVYKATLASMEVVMPVATKEVPPENKPVARKTVAAIAAPQAAADRCTETLGWARVVCQERARLESCEGREGDEAACPGPIPYSPPG